MLPNQFVWVLAGVVRPLAHDEYLAKHDGKIEVFSFAGAKGRKVISEEIYQSEDYKEVYWFSGNDLFRRAG